MSRIMRVIYALKLQKISILQNNFKNYELHVKISEAIQSQW